MVEPDEDGDDGAEARGVLGSRDEVTAGELRRAQARIRSGLGLEHANRLEARYTLGEQIGSGGLGHVHRAWDHKLERDVAVKFLRGQAESGADPEALAREAKMLARVQHPNIVTVYDTGVHDGEVYLAMELIDGSTMAGWLTRERRTLPEIVELFVQAGRALAHAHAEGTIHRDFKPANLMVDKLGRARVVDFGLARAVPEAEVPVTAVGPPSGDAASPMTRPAGTLPYMAPEQLDGHLSAASDQFAFCTSLYECLCGKRPWGKSWVRGVRDTAGARKLERRLRNHGVPRRLRKLLVRGLAQRPEDRYPSMDALLADLEGSTRRVPRVALAAVVASAAAIGWWGATRPQACDGRGTKAWALTEPDAEAGPASDDRDSARASNAPAWLTAFALQWNAMDVASCHALESGAVTPALYELRMRCLDQSLGRVEYLLSQISGGASHDPKREAAAARVAADLSACRDDEGLLIGHPDGDYDAALGDRIQRGIDRAYVHLVLGDVDTFAEILLELRQTVEPPGRAVPDELWLAMHLGHALTARGRPADAEAVLMPALLTAEGNPRWKRQVGALRTELAMAIARDPGRAAEAKLLARQAIATLTTLEGDRRFELPAHVAHATAAAQLGSSEEALDAIERALVIAREHAEHPEHAWPGFEVQLGQVHAVRASTLATAGRSAEAAEAYARAIEIFDAEQYTGNTLAGALNNLALLLRREGDLERAAQLLQRAAVAREDLDLPTEAATTYMNLANVRLGQGRHDAALAAFDDALRIAPANASSARAKIHFNRAIARQSREDLEGARADYEQVRALLSEAGIADDPLRMGASVGLGQVLLVQGDTAAALAVLREARAMETDTTSAYTRAELRLAMSRAVRGEDLALAQRLATEASEAALESGDGDLQREIDAWRQGL